MTSRDIQSYIQELYGLGESSSFVSQITNKIIGLAKEWHNRPFESIYHIVFFGAITTKSQLKGR
ncbi:Transposase [Ignavibacterium album JCM 16511]|uniref:Transposase n=1 Tax=Ignavibacterium album (strain DSM 19864 / JCM 16511 / NBRC 101810 / Mat9-16) TaxID=945713 RepID=I0AHZ4_IGNAJ|nr:Transposase [Ignavibacterium album JCM 16511]